MITWQCWGLQGEWTAILLWWSLHHMHCPGVHDLTSWHERLCLSSFWFPLFLMSKLLLFNLKRFNQRNQWLQIDDNNGSLSVFIHIKWSLSKSVIVTDTVNPLEHLGLCCNDFSANVNLWQPLLISKLMRCPKGQVSRNLHKCQEIYYSNNVCMMRSSLPVCLL